MLSDLNSDNIIIENNEINIGGKSSGIYAEQTSIPHSNWEIKENTISAPNSGVNIELYDVDDVLIDNNILRLSGSVSLVYSSENSNVGDLIISNNEFYGNGNIVGATPTIWIESDFQTGDDSSSVDDVLIEGNEFFNWVNAGIKIGEPGGASSYNEVNDVFINYNGFNSGSGPAIDNYVDKEIFDGTNNWWGDCKGPGPIGLGSGAGVSVNVTYTPWLGSCIGDKVSKPDCVLETDSVTLYANVTGYYACEVLFGVLINGTWQNHTGILSNGNYSAVVSGLIPGQINWTVYADDCYNHTTQNGIESFYANRRTSLSVFFEDPDGENGWYVTEPEFTLTNNDASMIQYRWDGQGPFVYSSPFGLENIPNAPANESAGILELTYWSDVCSEEEQSQTFYVDLKNPVIKNEEPEEGSLIYNTNPDIYAYIDDVYQSNSGINLTSVIVKLDGNVVSAIVTSASLDVEVRYTPTIDLTAGLHEVSVYVEDNAGRKTERNWTFEISTEILSLNLVSPEPINYDSRKTRFDISTNLDAKIEYSDNGGRFRRLCKNCDEYNKTKTFRDGEHNVIIRATWDEQQVEENITFKVDSKAPRISRVLPRKNKFTNGTGFYVKFKEKNIEKVTLNWNGSYDLKEEECNLNRYWECETSVDLSAHDGEEINYYFEVEDIIGRKDTKSATVKVDTTYPDITEISSEIDKSRVKLIINITEENLGKVQYMDLNYRLKWRTICRRLKDGQCEKKIRFRGDVPNIIIKVEDKADNFVTENLVI